jgi:acetate kinase
VAAGRVIAAHLGNGASLCAMRGGVSVETTMGFTALDGLMMGTRCGALDAGVVLHLLEQRGMTPAAVSDLLYNRSGLLGVSGISPDMHVLLDSPDPRAAEAVALFCARIVREAGALAAALGGLDGLVFAGGIGEHAAPVRETVCAGLGFLGMRLDPAANAAGAGRISAPDSRVAAFVIPTDEEAMIATEVQEVLDGQAAG